ncbi:PAS domain S-box-containing protein/diguanylate cyclase (GGDEF) domain-containing protein [Rhodoferax sp. OV413]|nr:PAS domain S-box-containing protein/diguanylate cyclase (GGDEF) domain-containing protein [Rhodoferax sp. OV413]
MEMRLDSSAEALIAQVTQLHSTLNQVGAYVFTKDLQGRYTYGNQMVCELFACSLQELVGRSAADFFDLSASIQIQLSDQRVLQQGQRVEMEEVNVFSHSGEERVYWSVKQPLFDAAGAVVGMCGVSTDITERRRLETRLREQKRLLDTVLNSLDALVYMKDHQRRYLYANANAAQLFGQTQASIVGKSDAEMIPQTEADRFGIMDQRVLGSGEKSIGEETFVDVNGVDRHYWSIKVPIESDGHVDAYVGISTDITEVVQLKEKFRDLANTDALTGILSRRCLLERAEHELKRARRAGAQVAIIAFDIDKFKLVNDGYGHAVGDRAIISVVEACKQGLRGTDLFGRIGGDEFVVVAVDTDLAGAVAAAERMRLGVFNAVISVGSGQRVPISSSFGLALSDLDTSLDELLSRADAMLYEAKQRGRNQVCYPELLDGADSL